VGGAHPHFFLKDIKFENLSNFSNFSNFSKFYIFQKKVRMDAARPRNKRVGGAHPEFFRVEASHPRNIEGGRRTPTRMVKIYNLKTNP